jgi:hypothetical protein
MTSSRTLAVASAVALVAASTATGALAHHSYAAFDRTKTVTVTGTVSEVEWTNPHTWFFVKAPGADGKVTDWAIEGDPPGGMTRAGWKKDAAKPGDKITIVINPMVTGQVGGHFVSAILPGNINVGRHADQKP